MKFSPCQRVMTPYGEGIVLEVLQTKDNLPYLVYEKDCGTNGYYTEEELKLLSMKEVNDGYHTFGDYMAHRMVLTATVCKLLQVANDQNNSEFGTRERPKLEEYGRAIRSWKHHPDDGPMFDDSFIVVIELPSIGQVSYHYNKAHWNAFEMCETVEHAPKYDGYDSNEVLGRFLQWVKDIL